MTKKDVEGGGFFLVNFQRRRFELSHFRFSVIGHLLHMHFEILLVDFIALIQNAIKVGIVLLDGFGVLQKAFRGVGPTVQDDVLDEVAQGLTNQQIAKRLHLSAKTVANHLYRAYPKLGVSSRTEAARHMLLRDGRADQLRSSAR